MSYVFDSNYVNLVNENVDNKSKLMIDVSERLTDKSDNEQSGGSNLIVQVIDVESVKET